MEFIPRAQWGHPYPSSHGGYYVGMQRQPYLVEHHTPGQDPKTYNEAVEEMQQIYSGHVGQGWQDIGYNFILFDKYCFEGRGFGYTGAHAPGANSISIGSAWLMDGRYRTPTPTEEQTLSDLVAAAQQYGYLSLDPTYTGHREWVSTSCPGDLIYANMPNLADAPKPGPPTSTEDDDMPEFEQRPGGVFPWKMGAIDYSGMGGACAYDHPDVKVNDLITICPTTPDVGPIVVNVFYPNAKQTQAREVRFGQPARIASEQAGFVTVLVSANGYNKTRVIIGRP